MWVFHGSGRGVGSRNGHRKLCCVDELLGFGSAGRVAARGSESEDIARDLTFNPPRCGTTAISEFDGRRKFAGSDFGVDCRVFQPQDVAYAFDGDKAGRGRRWLFVLQQSG